MLPLLLITASCADELGNNPQIEDCSLSLPFTIDPGPATIRFLVSANGVSIVETVSFTTPTGVETLTNPPDEEPDDIHLVRDVQFDAPATGFLAVTGEVADPGGIAIAYSIFPADPMAPVENAPPLACTA